MLQLTVVYAPPSDDAFGTLAYGPFGSRPPIVETTPERVATMQARAPGDVPGGWVSPIYDLPLRALPLQWKGREIEDAMHRAICVLARIEKLEGSPVFGALFESCFAVVTAEQQRIFAAPEDAQGVLAHGPLARRAVPHLAAGLPRSLALAIVLSHVHGGRVFTYESAP